jgi:phage terminase Nu1 subunit (DNA packaging protein)
MSTLAFQESGQQVVTSEEFNALEQRVLRAVELLRTERTARAAAEQKAAELEQLMEVQATELAQAQTQLKAYEGERDHVRQRVERMLKQLDEINA